MSNSIAYTSNGVLKPRRSKWKPVNYLCLAIALVPILSFVFFNAFPVVISFISMFVDMDNNQLDTMRWNNFENFVKVFNDTTEFINSKTQETVEYNMFWRAWRNTLILGTAPFVTLVIALAIATLLNQKIKGERVFQVLFFIPYICSGVAISIMWQWIFDKDLGAINAILGQHLEWLNNDAKPYLLQIAIYITILWSAPAYGIVMYKAALKNVNPSLYEAAGMDGCNGWQKFWHVTMPQIKPVTLFLLLASITQGLGLFDQVLILAPTSWTGHAGPYDSALTVNYYIYLRGVQDGEMELASVASWILFAVTFAISFFVIRARNKASEEA